MTQSPPHPVAEPDWREWILWICRRRKFIRVTGDSMQPTLSENDIMFVDLHAYRNTTPQRDDIVLAHHPYQRNLKIVKRVVDITPDTRLVLNGDNPSIKTDSRSFGALRPEAIIGKVTARIRFSQ